MIWDYAEANPLRDVGGSCRRYCVDDVAKVARRLACERGPGIASQADAQHRRSQRDKVVSTDPPYYDNIGYADLSDFFYVWLRRSLKPVFPDLFATLAVPKAEELVATPYRHGSKEKAEAFFLDGMTQAMHRLAEQAHPAFPVTIYYAFKQSESDERRRHRQHRLGDLPRRSDPRRLRHQRHLADAHRTRQPHDRHRTPTPSPPASSSSAARAPPTRPPPRAASSSPRSRPSCPQALAHLQRGNIAPVDLAQAAIGPGMAVYTRYAKVLDAEGKPLTVREALALINQTLDEALAEQEGDFDADSRWALTWFEQYGLRRGRVRRGRDSSRKSKNTSVAGMVEAGILESKRGKVRLLKPDELPDDWDPATDPRLTAWEIVHHLIRVLEAGGEGAAAELVAKLGAKAEIARELAYRLYTLCERKKRAAEALAYNGLVQSWPEIVRLAREGGKPQSRAGRRCSRRRGVSHGDHQSGTRRQGDGAAPSGARALRRARVQEPVPGDRLPMQARRYFGDDRLRRQEADRRVGRRGAAQADVGRVERRLPPDARPRRAHPGQRAARLCATSGRTRSRSPSDDADRALDSMARLLTAVSAPQADEVEQDEDGAAPAHASTSRCAARSARPAAR